MALRNTAGSQPRRPEHVGNVACVTFSTHDCQLMCANPCENGAIVLSVLSGGVLLLLAERAIPLSVLSGGVLFTTCGKGAIASISA